MIFLSINIPLFCYQKQQQKFQFLLIILRMDIRDFQGTTKYKAIIPICYVISWLWMMFGPVMEYSSYERYCAFFLLYMDIKVCIFFTIMVIITIKSNRIFKRAAQKSHKEKIPHSQIIIQPQIFYGFIIPNFKEEIQMLAQTLNVLAEHSRAKSSYLIFLAMEAHEQGCQKKAQKLIKMFQQKFRVVDYTRHQIRQHEQKGKASNVSWCAEHLEPIFQKNMINQQKVFLTILDADSWAPNLYFDILEQQILKNYSKRHSIIFQPPQIFTRNNLDVPITTRVYDIMHSFAHCTNLYSIFDFTFALSNYTLSYKFIKSIGFWDTCADAIGEDFHTCQKAYWKTNGQVKTIPIYVPFNQVNIFTGNGYIEDALARFWQAERHAQGCADMAWSLKMLLSRRFKLMNFIVFYQIFQNCILPTIVPWIFLSLMLQKNILFRETKMPEDSLPPIVMKVLFNVLSVVSTLGYFLFEIFKRRANRLIYKRQNEGILRIIQYPIMFSVNFFLIAVPTFVIAAFMSLLGTRQYIVAQKKASIKTNL